MENETWEKTGNEPLRIIQEMVESIRFGTISIIVQDGKIVRIEKNEKYRIKS